MGNFRWMNRSCPKETKTMFVQRKLPKGKGNSCCFHIRKPLISSNAIQPSAITSFVQHCKNEMRTFQISGSFMWKQQLPLDISTEK